MALLESVYVKDVLGNGSLVTVSKDELTDNMIYSAKKEFLDNREADDNQGPTVFHLQKYIDGNAEYWHCSFSRERDPELTLWTEDSEQVNAIFNEGLDAVQVHLWEEVCTCKCDGVL